MMNLTGKVTGNNLTAAEWNELPAEVQNVITGLGIGLSSGDLNQLGKAIAGYVANGNFYTDSGAADAYVLTLVGVKQTQPSYTNGTLIRFIAGNTNTGASTVNKDGLGVKSLLLFGAAVPAGFIEAGSTITAIYDGTNFKLIPFTGSSLFVYSNSSATTLKNLADLFNDNVLATGTVPLKVRQDSTSPAINIDSNGNGPAINIDSEALSANVVDIDCTPMTSGTGLKLLSNNAGFTGNLLLAQIDDGASTGNCLRLLNQGVGETLFIDSNGNGKAIKVDSESTTETVFDLDVFTLTAGTGQNITSTAAGFTGKLLGININNAGASGDGISIFNAGTGTSVLLDTNGDASSITIDSEALTANVVDIDCTPMTSGIGVKLLSNAAGFTGDLIKAQIDNGSATGNGIAIINQGTGNALNIDQDGNAPAIDIDAEVTTGTVVNIDCSPLTAGVGLKLISNVSGFTGNLLQIQIDNGGSTGEGLAVINQGDGDSIDVTNNGDGIALKIVNSTGTGNGIDISQSGAGIPLKIAATLSSAEGIEISKGNQATAGFIDFIAGIASDLSTAITSRTTSATPSHHLKMKMNGTTFFIPGSTTAPTA